MRAPKDMGKETVVLKNSNGSPEGNRSVIERGRAGREEGGRVFMHPTETENIRDQQTRTAADGRRNQRKPLSLSPSPTTVQTNKHVGLRCSSMAEVTI